MNEKIRNILLSVIASMACAILLGVWKFYRDWTIDEQTEEAVMFDSPQQKVETTQHAVKVPTEEIILHMRMTEAMQSELLEDVHKILERQDAQDSINRRTHDQIYQLNQRSKQ